MKHIFYGHLRDCIRVADSLGIKDPKIIHSHEDLKGLRGDITEHVCRPKRMPMDVLEERWILRAKANVTTIYHHHDKQKGPSRSPGPKKPHPRITSQVLVNVPRLRRPRFEHRRDESHRPRGQQPVIPDHEDRPGR